MSQSTRAYIITGPTSGIGYQTAIRLAAHGTLILVGRDASKLSQLENTIKKDGHHAVSVVADVSDVVSVRKAVKEILALKLNIVGLINNAGINEGPKTDLSPQGYNLAFATNTLGPFILTEALIPHLPDGANIVFLASAVEDPERKPAEAAGFKASRYISIEASSRGEWKPEGSAVPGYDSYATTKQSSMVSALELAKENPRLYINIVEPGFIPNTNLGRASGYVGWFVMHCVLPFLAPYMEFWSNPPKAGALIVDVVLNKDNKTGEYFDDNGKHMELSKQAQDPKFRKDVTTELREFIAKHHPN